MNSYEWAMEYVREMLRRMQVDIEELRQGGKEPKSVRYLEQVLEEIAEHNEFYKCESCELYHPSEGMGFDLKECEECEVKSERAAIKLERGE
jgi:hypothetical protein